MIQRVRNPPAIQETWVRSRGWEDSLEKEMATHSSIFAWEVPWTEEPGGLQSMGSQEMDRTEQLNNNIQRHGVDFMVLVVEVFFAS